MTVGPLDDWLRARGEQRAEAGLRRRLRTPPRACVDLASNDYLGLSRDPRVVAAARAALDAACAVQAEWVGTAPRKPTQEM